MQKSIEKIVNIFLEKSKDKKIRIVSHHDTDGITSAVILTKALERLDKNFSVKIIKGLEENIIKELPKDELIIFLDLASSNLMNLSEFPDIFVIDHHEITTEVPGNVNLINPHLFHEENISASGLTYLFARQINPENKDLANLAVVGMVGDMLDRDLGKLNNKILEDAEVTVKKSILLYPSTRPINKTLEFSSLFIPGVTGNSKGCFEILREAGIERGENGYKTLIELNEEESSKLLTAILLRRIQKDNTDIIGNLYLIKFFNKLEDARELSAMINACSRLGYSEVAMLLCMGSKTARKKAEEIYADYKQHIVSALNLVSTMQKIEGKGYVIINAGNEIKDTIIGTIASILSNSSMYEEGTIIVGMANSDDKIKVSARIAGRNGRNVREVLEQVTSKIGGECGGHHMAAGCLILQNQEQQFLDYLIKALDIELVKI